VKKLISNWLQNILVTLAVVLFIAYKFYEIFEDDFKTIFNFIRGKKKKVKSAKQQLIDSFDKENDKDVE